MVVFKCINLQYHSYSLFSLLVFLVAFPACLPWCFLSPQLLKIKPAWLKWLGFVAGGSDFRSLVRQQSKQCSGIAFMQSEKLLLIKFTMSWLKKLSWRSDQLSPPQPCHRVPVASLGSLLSQAKLPGDA